MIWLYLSIFLPSIVFANFNISDEILHGIEWMGLMPQTFEESSVIKPIILPIRTTNDEIFHCLLPSKVHQQDFVPKEESKKHHSESDLLSPLFYKLPCSYKIEGYWVYELCHNKHVRQYHEDQQPEGATKVTEYYLGYFHVKDSLFNKKSNEEKKEKPPTLEYHGKVYAYYEVFYTQGTICDLTGNHRTIAVRYICDHNGKGEMIDLEEVASCNYVAIVIAKQLCSHPNYKATETYVNKIQCYTKQSTPTTTTNNKNVKFSPKPKALLKLEKESITSSRDNVDGTFGSGAIHVEVIKTEDSSVIFKIKSKEDDKLNKNNKLSAKEENSAPPTGKAAVKDLPSGSAALLKSFLRGEYCIMGGSGWWKHELCFQKSALQFHDEANGGRTVIVIGIWKKENHLAWLEKNPLQGPSMPPESRTEIRQFYSDGDECAITKKPREAVVIIKCIEDVSTSVSISFSEPKTCEYVIVAKSSIFCPLVKQSDNNALLPDDSTLK